MTFSLIQLRTDALNRADQVIDTPVSEDEANRIINSAARELYDIFVLEYEDYFTTIVPTQFTLTGSQNTYQLPSDFKKLSIVECGTNGSWTPVNSIKTKQRSQFNGAWLQTISGPSTGVVYQLKGNPPTLVFYPETSAVGTYRFDYVPELPELVSDGQLLPDMLGFEEYIIETAAIWFSNKEETDTMMLQNRRAELVERIKLAAANRDMGGQRTIADTYGSEW